MLKLCLGMGTACFEVGRMEGYGVEGDVRDVSLLYL